MDLSFLNQINMDYMMNLFFQAHISVQNRGNSFQNTLNTKAVAQKSSIGFNNILSAKDASSTAKTQQSFKDMLKTAYPGAYYNVMDTSKIDKNLWGRNDYPHEQYFREPADESILNWKPTGKEPPMSDPKVQARIGSTIGKKSVVIPPELEEKMKNDPELARKVMEKVEDFITRHTHGNLGNGSVICLGQGFLITFDENGEIANSCVTGASISYSSSEMVEERKKRDEIHAEFERIAEENVLKRKLWQKGVTYGYLFTGSVE